jgi:hypothetical protein
MVLAGIADVYLEIARLAAGTGEETTLGDYGSVGSIGGRPTIDGEVGMVCRGEESVLLV